MVSANVSGSRLELARDGDTKWVGEHSIHASLDLSVTWISLSLRPTLKFDKTLVSMAETLHHC